MLKLGQKLEAEGIPYIWLYFSQERIPSAPANMIHMKPTLDIQPFIQKADYLVQLSDSEAFGYSIIEALEAGTAIITTPLEVLPELGVTESVHGYIVPFDVEEFDCTKLLNVPEFEFKWDNAKIIKKWRKILGNTKPTRKYTPKQNVKVRIVRQYQDIILNRILKMGELVEMQPSRAEVVVNAGYGRIEI